MILKELLSSGIDSIIDSVGNALDKLVTSDEERQELKNEIEQIRLDAKIKAEDKALQLDKEITKRWELDNDHIVTRLVRPAIVLWSFFLFTIVMLCDGNIGKFSVNPSYIPMLETVMTTVIIAFFGSRGIEKVTKTIKKSGTIEDF